MNKPRIEIEGSSIVLIGSFNPSIFNPQWLLARELISESDNTDSKVNIISPQVSSFELSWCSVTVTQDRYQAMTTKSPFYELLRDLVIGTFSVLEHTPVRQMGINWYRHYKLSTEEEYHQLGHTLAPKAPWEGLLEKPGLSYLRIEGQRKDDKKGRLYAVVAPSNLIKLGIYVEVNDHFDISHLHEENAALGCKPVIDILSETWDASLQQRDNIINGVIGEGK
jgi:hypothetical protein